MEFVLPTVQEFQPSVETVLEEDCDTILLYLPGFKKEQLRVQLTTSRNLVISGERKLENQNILSRFRKEFPVSTNVDTNKISAKFEGGILFIRQPKLITPVGNNQVVLPKPPVEPTMPQKPVAEPQPEKKDQTAKSAKPIESDSKKSVPNKAQGEEIEQKLNSKDSNNVPDQEAAKEKKGESASGSEGEKSGITGGNGKKGGETSEKRASDSVDGVTKKGGEGDDGGKKTLDNYRQSVGGLTTKLKKPRKVMNVLVAVLMALVLAIYVKNYFKWWKTEEIGEL